MADNVDVVVFRGIKFRRYPDAKNWSERAYFVPGIADRQKGVRRLHEEIWMAQHGEIPDGSHIHHKDHDHLNNSPDNLVCASSEDHNGHHSDARRGVPVSEERKEHLDRIRPLAAEWHRSEAGREHARKNAAKSWEGREAVSYVCERCFKPFESKDLNSAKVRFCSNACKAAARRASGVDNEDRTCAWCGTTYSTDKYAKSETCSRSCRVRRSRAQRSAN